MSRPVCALRVLPLAAVAAVLAGCAISIVQEAPAGRQSDGDRTVIAGRMNYVIDGRLITPYGWTRPAWPAPVMEAISLATGNMHAFPAVDSRDGRFRWQLAPGAYLVSRIGVGTFTDDTYIAWPRVVLCVPSAPGRTVYVGHLRLEGTRYTENVVLSTGTSYVARGVRYEFRVDDEREGAADQPRALMRHVPDFPSGDRLQEQWKRDPQGLAKRACPTIGS